MTPEQLERFRQSGIRLDRNGRFWHEGERVTHHGLVQALWSWLDKNPDGRFVLRLDEKRFVYLDVDDTPYVIRSIHWQDETAVALLSDGSEEPVAFDSLVERADRELISQVKGGQFAARWLAPAVAALEPFVKSEGDELFVQTASARWPIVRQAT